MKYLKFSIRDLLIVTLLAAVGLKVFTDYRNDYVKTIAQLTREKEQLKREHFAVAGELRLVNDRLVAEQARVADYMKREAAFEKILDDIMKEKSKVRAAN